MEVPPTLAESTSPSPAKLPPVMETVALTKLALSKSVTVMLGDIVVVLPWVNANEETTDVSVGGSCAILMVVVAALLRLNELPPSLRTQVTVRVGLALPLLGLTPDAKVTLSRTF